MHIQAVVIGAGVVGLATARALARRGRETLILESERRVGSITSGRNSEVVHAGIYYPAGSLKARACVAGRRMLQTYCHEHAVPLSRVSKLIVATSEKEARELPRIQNQARQNGLTEPEEALRVLSAEDVRSLEPEVRCHGALLSPSTSIIDSHALMLALQADAEACGATVAFSSRVVGGRVSAGRGGRDGTDAPIRLRVAVDEPHSPSSREGAGASAPQGTNMSGREELGHQREQSEHECEQLEPQCEQPDSVMDIECDICVNCSGLAGPSIAASLRGMPEESIPPSYFAKGNYYALTCAWLLRAFGSETPWAVGLYKHVYLALVQALRAWQSGGAQGWATGNGGFSTVGFREHIVSS
jgi:L-2-hydroxyglutarate oxidase LhgO